VIPFLICGLIVAAIFARWPFTPTLAGKLAGRFHSPDLSLPLVLIIGAALCYLLYWSLPGFCVWGLVTWLGMGAVLLALFGPLFHRDQHQSMRCRQRFPSSEPSAHAQQEAGGIGHSEKVAVRAA